MIIIACPLYSTFPYTHVRHAIRDYIQKEIQSEAGFITQPTDKHVKL
jgi:hypothetical protein